LCDCRAALVTDLGAAAPEARDTTTAVPTGGISVNDSGMVAGTEGREDGSICAFLWRPDVGKAYFGALDDRVSAMNAAGDVAVAHHEAGTLVVHLYPFDAALAGGAPINLGPLGESGDSSVAWSLNANRVAVGEARGAAGTADRRRAAAFSTADNPYPGGTIVASSIGDGAVAWSVSDSGAIAGAISVGAEENPHTIPFQGQIGASSIRLIMLPAERSFGTAWSVNDVGTIVGAAYGDGARHAFKFEHGEFVDLVPGEFASTAYSLDLAGDAVGYVLPLGMHRSVAALFLQDGMVADLNAVPGVDSSWHLLNAQAVSPNGRFIVGYGERGGVLHCFRLQLR
jgi:hypothetical protein